MPTKMVKSLLTFLSSSSASLSFFRFLLGKKKKESGKKKWVLGYLYIVWEAKLLSSETDGTW